MIVRKRKASYVLLLAQIFKAEIVQNSTPTIPFKHSAYLKFRFPAALSRHPIKLTPPLAKRFVNSLKHSGYSVASYALPRGAIPYSGSEYRWYIVEVVVYPISYN